MGDMSPVRHLNVSILNWEIGRRGAGEKERGRSGGGGGGWGGGGGAVGSEVTWLWDGW